MNLHDLPADLEQYVQQEIAAGHYASEDELVTEALRVLKERVAHHQPPYPINGGKQEAPAQAQTPDDYIRAISQALETGDAFSAQQLAMEGAAHHPDHAELQKYAHVLAPSKAQVVVSTPERRAAVQADNVWLNAHWEQYRGNWIALKAGQLLYASPSFDEVIAHVGDVRNRNILLTKLN